MSTQFGDDVIEAVARALAPKAWAELDERGRGTLANQNRRTASKRHALQALTAACAKLREPSEEMLATVLEPVGTVYDHPANREAIKAEWRAMLSALLREVV